jgi:Glycosyltransferase family 87
MIIRLTALAHSTFLSLADAVASLQVQMNIAHKEKFTSRVHRSTWISLLVWLFALSPLVNIALAPDHFQWDLRVFYSAGMTFEKGYNPYDKAQSNVVFPAAGEFFYPPLTLTLSRALTPLPYEMVYLLWLGLKLSTLIMLFVIWHKGFEPLNSSYPLVLFFLLAYGSTIYRDVAAGNISIFEQFGLWLGFFFLIRKQYLLFGICVAVISQFKLQPIVFLCLLLVIEERAKWLEFVVSLAFFLAMLSLNFLIYPALTSAFIARIVILAGGRHPDEVGALNPSLLALIRDGTSFLSKRTYQLPWFVDTVAYLVAVSSILFSFLYFFLTYRQRHPNYDVRRLVYAACFVYSVTAARMKDYSYIICLLPTLSILRRRKDELDLVPIVAVLVLAAPITYVPYLGRLSGYFYTYLPLLAAGMMLWLCLDEFRKLSQVGPALGAISISKTSIKL